MNDVFFLGGSCNFRGANEVCLIGSHSRSRSELTGASTNAPYHGKQRSPFLRDLPIGSGRI